jgi:hypothetical protein
MRSNSASLTPGLNITAANLIYKRTEENKLKKCQDQTVTIPSSSNSIPERKRRGKARVRF